MGEARRHSALERAVRSRTTRSREADATTPPTGPRPQPAQPASLRELIHPATAPADHFASGFPGRHPFGSDVAFLDLETTGLSSADRIVLAGLLLPRDDGLLLVQELAFDDAAERQLLQRVLVALEGRSLLVTYNGASFDLPFLCRRLAWHGLAPLTPGRTHVDLMHEIRRRYGEQLPDCRLTTLEQHLLGKQRMGPDVPGAEVPARVAEYRKHGQPEVIEPVIRHNRIDLTSLAALLERLQRESRQRVHAVRRTGRAPHHATV